MKRTSYLILALVFSLNVPAPSQDARLPRDPDKLIDRVQKFWAAITSNQRFSALEFVLPERRNAFLSGAPMPILKAKVLGLDLTTKSDQAAVRVGLDVFSTESASGFLTWTVTDPWVWKGGNWYLNMNRPPDIFPRGTEQSPIDPKEVRLQIEKNFQILRDPIDLGRLIGAQYLSVEVPIRYTGDLPVSLDLGLPNPLVALGVMAEPITPRTKSFVLLVSTEDWDGPLTLPLPLKIRYQDVIVERTLVVKGDVFVPVTFRQYPADGPVPERGFSVFIRNNTDELAPVHSVLVDGKMDLLKRPDVLPPHQEVEVIFKPRPNEIPDRLYLVLDTPIEGRSSYTYRIRNAQH